MVRVERRLTAAQCNELGGRIVSRLYDLCSGGTQYGIDMPTMRILWPVRMRVLDRLKARWRETRCNFPGCKGEAFDGGRRCRGHCQ